MKMTGRRIVFIALLGLLVISIMQDINKMRLLQRNQLIYRETSAILLKEIIRRDAPGIDRKNSDFEKVNMLREWAHVNIDVASQHARLDQEVAFQFYGRSAADIFSAFFVDRGGVLCGGAAYVLKKLYNIYGYDAYTVDSGKPGVFTHVVTLVEIHHNGERRTVIEDPTFNLTYVHRDDGVPYDYHELLSILKTKGHGKIKVLYGDSRKKAEFLLHPLDERHEYDYAVAQNDKPIMRLSDGKQKFASQFSLMSSRHAFGEKIHEFLAGEGYPDDPIYLFLYPIKKSAKSVAEEM